MAALRSRLAVLCRRSAVVAFALAMLLGVSAVPASAVVQKSGNTNCSTNYHVEVYGVFQGNGKYYWPTTTFRYSSYHVSLYGEGKLTWKTSTSWKVTSDDLISDQTRGRCLLKPL